MRLLSVTCFLLVSLYFVNAKPEAEEKKSDVTKLDVVDLGEAETDADVKDSEVQRKRDSGYSYNRPDRFTLATRARFQLGQSAYKGRIVTKHPSQINRPVTKYGPPSTHQNSPLTKPGPHGQQHRDKLHQQGHFNQQHSNNLANRPAGPLFQQEVPSPIRHFDFAEQNPIASQNNEPFGFNTANYLPPRNQKLPGYTAAQTFDAGFGPQTSQINGQPNSHGQSIVQSQEQQISDAALFLTENAHAIQQLYGAAATEQDFAPNNDQFSGNNNQVQHGQLQSFESSSRNPFAGALPSYASGTLNSQETLEQIQNLEKDRLIVQLQRALAVQSQSQSAETEGRYAQNQPSFVQNQDLLASLGQQTKLRGFTTQQSTLSFGNGNTGFNQSPFLPGTTIAPAGIPLSYGLPATTQAPIIPTTTASTPTPGVGSVPHQPGSKGDGTTQVGASLPAPSHPGTHAATPSGIPVYGGFVPLLPSPSFVAGVPSYGTGLLATGTVAAIQPSGSSPTHFGIPIPVDHGQKPATGTGTTPSVAPSHPGTTPAPARPGTPSAPPVNAFPIPVHPVATPLHPITPLHPVIPAGHPTQTPITGTVAHPTYGLQTPAINQVFYKPIKPIYPFYYYPNVAYQLQKPVLPAYQPWSYAPAYAQAKPAQIWK